MSKFNELLQEASRRTGVLNTQIPKKLDTPNDWIEEWIRQNKLEYSYDGNHSFVDCLGNIKSISNKTLIDILVADSYSVNQLYIKQMINAYISTWINREELKARTEALKVIAFDENLKTSNQIENYVTACTGKKDPLDIAVIKNFIWAVKRKMRGMPITRHLFTIFQGGQNAGKSTAVRKLLEPVKLFSSSRSLDMLNDPREIAVLTVKSVIWFDEMSKANKADVEAIKQYTTNETISFRIMYTQHEATAKNISTFIGCTNKHVEEIINDPTGARRFYELTCLSVMNHELINSINYLEMWKSVNEFENSSPVEPLIELLIERQKKLKAVDSVEDFLREEQLVATEDDKKMEISFNDLYSLYAKWMDGQKRNNPFTKRNFAKRLGDLGIESSRRSSSRTKILKFNSSYESFMI